MQLKLHNMILPIKIYQTITLTSCNPTNNMQFKSQKSTFLGAEVNNQGNRV